MDVKPAAIDWIDYETVLMGRVFLTPAPFLPVTVENGLRRQATAGLVDSGSDFSGLPLAVAKALGCPLSREVDEVELFGARSEVRTAVVTLRVPTRLGLLSFHGVECAVPVSGGGTDFAILGRAPLFGEVEVRFQDWLDRFGLQKRSGHLHPSPQKYGRSGAGDRGVLTARRAGRALPPTRPLRRRPPPR